MLPGPVNETLAESVTQAGGPVTDQVHVEPVLTSMRPLPPAAGKLWDVGFMEYEHVAAAA